MPWRSLARCSTPMILFGIGCFVLGSWAGHFLGDYLTPQAPAGFVYGLVLLLIVFSRSLPNVAGREQK